MLQQVAVLVVRVVPHSHVRVVHARLAPERVIREEEQVTAAVVDPQELARRIVRVRSRVGLGAVVLNHADDIVARVPDRVLAVPVLVERDGPVLIVRSSGTIPVGVRDAGGSVERVESDGCVGVGAVLVAVRSCP